MKKKGYNFVLKCRLSVCEYQLEHEKYEMIPKNGLRFKGWELSGKTSPKVGEFERKKYSAGHITPISL